MKKLILAILPALVCISCARNYTYSDLINKMKTYPDETLMDNYYSNGFYSEEGFFTSDDGNVTLYEASNGDGYQGYVFITLHTATDVPDNFYCLYSFTTSYGSEAASFYISNNYTSQTKISFHAYNGSSDTKQSSQGLAKSSVDLILTIFDIWLDDTLHTSLNKIGLFPNFH